MTKKFLYITLSLSILSILFQALIGGIISSLYSIIHAILLGFLLAIFSLLFVGRAGFFLRVCRYMLIFLSISGCISGLILITATISHFSPTSLSRITLSNGTSNIIFIQMSHIATERYYENIRKDLESLTNSGYIIYSEGVRPGTPENTEKFYKFLGITLKNDTYSKIAKVFGLVAQDQSLYANISTGKILHVDISIDDIITIIGTGQIVPEREPIDIGEQFADMELENNRFFHFIMRGILNIFLRLSLNTDIISGSLDSNVMYAILDKRNAHIVSVFDTRKDTNAVFVYGALHFDGIYKALKDIDPKWDIVDFSPIYPYLR